MKGKLIAGALGLLSGGWLGLFIGLLIGHWFDKSMALMKPPSVDRQRQIIEKCFELMGAVCKADGRVSQAEIQAAEAVMARLRIDGEQKRAAIAAFNRGKNPGFDVDSAASELRQLCQGKVLWLRLGLQILMSGAMADGHLDSSEREMLVRIGNHLGISSAEFEQMLAMLSGQFGSYTYGPGGAGRPQGPSPAQRLKEAYAVLGIAEDCSDAEAKKAYRRLMSRHHPDKIAAREMPDAMREQAEEQVRKIRSAWDTVAAARGLG